MLRFTTPGRAWAYLYLTAGLVVSALANLKAAYIDDAHPDRILLALAAAPPIFMFGSIEVLTRNPWPDVPHWQKIKHFVAYGVAVPAAIISYIHLVHLAINGHTTGPNAWIYWLIATMTPLMIDGVIGACTAALLIPASGADTSDAVKDRGEGNRPAITAGLDLERLFQSWRAETEALAFRLQPDLDQWRIVLDEVLAVRLPETRRSESVSRKRKVESPVWPAFLAAHQAGEPWDRDRLVKEFANIGDVRDPEAVRHVLRRWNERAGNLT
jgi:hypothetical protein